MQRRSHSACFRFWVCSRRELSFSRVPIRGRERDAPEVRRSFKEFQPHFGFSLFASSRIDYAAGQFLRCLRIYQMDLLAAFHKFAEKKQAAIGADGNRRRCLLKIRAAHLPAHVDGYGQLHPLAAAAFPLICGCCVQHAVIWLGHGFLAFNELLRAFQRRTRARIQRSSNEIALNRNNRPGKGKGLREDSGRCPKCPHRAADRRRLTCVSHSEIIGLPGGYFNCSISRVFQRIKARAIQRIKSRRGRSGPSSFLRRYFKLNQISLEPFCLHCAIRNPNRHPDGS